jgi:glycosyltransferase involved in cell wall biosynthesis
MRNPGPCPVLFVVPAHNEGRYLGATLASIHTAAGAAGVGYEIVVANDASTDDTAAAARDGGARVVDVEHRQIAATRNSGARAGRGDRLIFVDGDTRVDADVVRAALAAMDAGAAGGGAAVRFDAAPWWGRLVVWLTSVGFRWTGYAAGCFVFCTREAFERSGGFDEAYFGAEEIVFSKALKRHGRFVVLRESVTTSARKLRHRSFFAMLAVFLRIALRGPGALKRRRGMEFWYDDPR